MMQQNHHYPNVHIHIQMRSNQNLFFEPIKVSKSQYCKPGKLKQLYSRRNDKASVKTTTTKTSKCKCMLSFQATEQT